MKIFIVLLVPVLMAGPLKGLRKFTIDLIPKRIKYLKLPDDIENIKKNREIENEDASTLEGYINPKKVLYSQDSINLHFKNGNSILDTIKGLEEGSIDPKEFPPIRLYPVNILNNGQLIEVPITLDNRRLRIFSEVNKEIPYKSARDWEVKEDLFKFTNGHWGKIVKIREKECEKSREFIFLKDLLKHIEN